MKRIVSLLVVIAIVPGVAIGCCHDLDYSFYLKVDSGVSCSGCVNISAPNPPWSPAIQGYNATLGHSPIAGANIGCEFSHVMDVEVGISNRSTFKYRKFQTPTTGGGSYTREFDLSITSILFSVLLLGRGVPHCNWDLCHGMIYPLLGVGLGGSNLLITNYRTTGLTPTGDSVPYASFSAENQYTLCRKFTYAFLAGLEYSSDANWAIGTGYRWFDAGRFCGPRYQRVANGAAVDVACDRWKMRFRAHEWFVEFKIFV